MLLDLFKLSTNGTLFTLHISVWVIHYGVLVDIIMHLLDLQHVYVVFNSYCWLIPLVTAAKCTENVHVFGLQFRGCIFVMLWVRYLFFCYWTV